MRYFYYDLIADFLSKDTVTILGNLSEKNNFNLTIEQRNTWIDEIVILKNVLSPYSGKGSLWIEYSKQSNLYFTKKPFSQKRKGRGVQSIPRLSTAYIRT